MAGKRRFTAEFKAKVVLEILAGKKSLAQASREYGITASVLWRWKQEFIERSPQMFEQRAATDERDQRIVELERMIGQLTMELDVAKKVFEHLDSSGGENDG